VATRYIETIGLGETRDKETIVQGETRDKETIGPDNFRIMKKKMKDILFLINIYDYTEY